MLVYFIGGTQMRSVSASRCSVSSLTTSRPTCSSRPCVNRSGRVHDVRTTLLLGIHFGLIHQLADRRDQRILPIGAVVGREAHRLVGGVRVRREAAAEQLEVLVREHVLIEFVELGADQRHAAGAERRARL